MSNQKKILILGLILIALILISKLETVYDVYEKETGNLLGEAKTIGSTSVEYYSLIEGESRYNLSFKVPRNSVNLKRRITFKIFK